MNNDLESPWNEALLLSTSIAAAASASNVSKLDSLAGLMSSGEDFSFFLNVFVFRRSAMGVDRGGFRLYTFLLLQ